MTDRLYKHIKTLGVIAVIAGFVSPFFFVATTYPAIFMGFFFLIIAMGIYSVVYCVVNDDKYTRR